MIGHLEESRFRQTLEAFDASAETEALASQIYALAVGGESDLSQTHLIVCF